MNDIEFTLHKSKERSTAFDEVYEKIGQLEQLRKTEESRMLQTIEKYGYRNVNMDDKLTAMQR